MMKIKTVKLFRSIPYAGRLSDVWESVGPYLIHLRTDVDVVEITSQGHDSLIVPLSQVLCATLFPEVKESHQTPPAAPRMDLDPPPPSKVPLTVKVAPKASPAPLKPKAK